MPPLGGAAKNYNIGAQLHSLPYAKTSKVWLKLYATYWLWCAQIYKFRPILALPAQIWYYGVSVCKEISEIVYIDAQRLQYINYKTLVKFYLLAAYKWTKSCEQTFRQDFDLFFLQFLPILAKSVAPPNNLV